MLGLDLGRYHPIRHWEQGYMSVGTTWYQEWVGCRRSYLMSFFSPSNSPTDNFELTADDELTLKGFLDLHVMTAKDEEGGEEEVSDVLSSLGYNKQLQLDQVPPHSLLCLPTPCTCM